MRRPPRSPLRRKAPLKRRGNSRSDLERSLSAIWAEEVREERCVVCGYDPLDPPAGDLRVIRGHHWLRQQVIKREAYRLGLFGENLIRALWNRRNRGPVCDPCHEGHHPPGQSKIRLELVPAEALSFADELGLRRELERDYAA